MASVMPWSPGLRRRVHSLWPALLPSPVSAQLPPALLFPAVSCLLICLVPECSRPAQGGQGVPESESPLSPGFTERHVTCLRLTDQPLWALRVPCTGVGRPRWPRGCWHLVNSLKKMEREKPGISYPSIPKARLGLSCTTAFSQFRWSLSLNKL